MLYCEEALSSCRFLSSENIPLQLVYLPPVHESAAEQKSFLRVTDKRVKGRSHTIAL